MEKQFNKFNQFYPFYLSEHSNPINRRLHVIGSLLFLATILYVLWSGDWRWLLAAPIFGYGFAWLGHYLLEKNHPATFKHPLYSFIADWVMMKDMLVGKIKF